MAIVFNLQTDIHGNSGQLTNRCLHVYVTQKMIVSRGHPNFIFASARGSRGLLVMNKMFCTNLFIEKTFNINIMLNITKITIVNRVHAKSIVLFAVSHCDVAHLLICLHHSIQIMAKFSKFRTVSVQ